MAYVGGGAAPWGARQIASTHGRRMFACAYMCSCLRLCVRVVKTDRDEMEKLWVRRYESTYVDDDVLGGECGYIYGLQRVG